MESKCSAFWHHTNVRNDNRIFPCCRFKQPVKQFNGDLNQILLSDEYSILRSLSEQNIPIKGCEKCYHEESIGKKSLRQEFNETYDTDTVSLDFLEIGFDNICNLTCDSCWGEFSSAWAKKTNPSSDKTVYIKSIDEITAIPDTINKVLFLGGEPLMTNRHKRLLKLIADPSKVSVTYNTNGTFLLDNETVEILKQFNNIEFILSIDGYNKLNDQVRSGSTWSSILQFIEQVNTLKFKLSIHTVIHKNNWHGMADLVNFIQPLDLKWTTNVLTYPSHLNIAAIEDKSKVRELFESIEFPNKDYTLRHLYEN